MNGTFDNTGSTNKPARYRSSLVVRRHPVVLDEHPISNIFGRPFFLCPATRPLERVFYVNDCSPKIWVRRLSCPQTPLPASRTSQGQVSVVLFVFSFVVVNSRPEEQTANNKQQTTNSPHLTANSKQQKKANSSLFRPERILFERTWSGRLRAG
jgi:hypothetical protein